jgi:L-fuconolactonase
MRVDAHHHAWGSELLPMSWMVGDLSQLARPAPAAQYDKFAASASFDASVLIEAAGDGSDFRSMLNASADSTTVRSLVIGLDRGGLASPAARSGLMRRLRHTRSERISGVRWSGLGLFGPKWLLNRGVGAGLDGVEESGLLLELLVRTPEMPSLIQMAASRGGLRAVIDHLGKPPLTDAERAVDAGSWEAWMAKLAELPNVHVKLSGIANRLPRNSGSSAQDLVDYVIEHFGAERVLLGSDWPVCRVAARPIDVVATYRGYIATRSPSQRAAIEGETAARLYGLLGADGTRSL